MHMLTTPYQSLHTDDAAAVEAVYALGHWLLGQDRHEDAAMVFRLMMRTAPTDERGWLALGTCHEKREQPLIALELYGGGAVAAEPSALCHLARFRTLWDLDRIDEADEALEAAREIATQNDDEELLARIDVERRVRP